MYSDRDTLRKKFFPHLSKKKFDKFIQKSAVKSKRPEELCPATLILQYVDRHWESFKSVPNLKRASEVIAKDLELSLATTYSFLFRHKPFWKKDIDLPKRKGKKLIRVKTTSNVIPLRKKTVELEKVEDFVGNFSLELTSAKLPSLKELTLLARKSRAKELHITIRG